MRVWVISFAIFLVLSALLIAIRGGVEEALPFLPVILAVSIAPLLVQKYKRYQELKAMEDAFPEFLRSLAEAQRSGINLPQAIKQASRVDYGPLTKEIRKMAVQISWGVPLPEVLQRFAERVKESDFLRRSIAIILQAYMSGGNIAEVMDSVANSARMIKELEAERKSKLNQQIMIMYAIFLIFLVIVVALNKILVPMFSLSGIQSSIGGLSFSTVTLNPRDYQTLFLHMIIIQAIFSGLLAGQVGEGSVIAGLKHSLIMLALGTLAFALFIPKSTLLVTVEEIYDIIPVGSSFEVTGAVTTLDGKPVANAQVIAKLSEFTFTGRTNDYGEFKLRLVAPKKPGDYEVKIEVKSRAGEKGEKSLQVRVR